MVVSAEHGLNNFRFSPSNLDQFRQCPRRFQAQYITKELPYQETPQRQKGMAVHTLVERMLQCDPDPGRGLPRVDTLDAEYMTGKIAQVRALQSTCGHELRVEDELCVTRFGTKTGWWDVDGYLRCKADIVLYDKRNEMNPSGSRHMIADIKTGKKWDSDHFQLRLECLMYYVAELRKFQFTQPVTVQYGYWYVESGETAAGKVTFGPPKDRNSMDIFSVDCPAVADILAVIKDAERAVKTNTYIPTKNRFCKWCPLHETPACGVNAL